MKKVARLLSFFFIVIFAGMLLGATGLSIGALLGGNYPQSELIVFGDYRGYEATGLAGFILGFVTGIGIALWLLRKKHL